MDCVLFSISSGGQGRSLITYIVAIGLFSLLLLGNNLILVDPCHLVDLALLVQQRLVQLYSEITSSALESDVTRDTVVQEYLGGRERGDMSVGSDSLHLPTTGIHRFRAVSHSNSLPSSVSRMNLLSSLEKETRGSASNEDGD